MEIKIEIISRDIETSCLSLNTSYLSIALFWVVSTARQPR